MLALIREGEGVAARVLNNAGVSLNKARQQVLQLLGSNDSSVGSQGTSNSASTPTLDSLARDLTEVAREGTLDPVIGRSKEITRVIEVLARRTKNNLYLSGNQVSVKQRSRKDSHNKSSIMKCRKFFVINA